MKKKLILLLFSITNLVFSQEHKFLDYPKFDETDLKKTHSQIEKNAPAEILYNSVSYNVASSERYPVTKNFFSKIKIYDKKNAEEWLNIEIPVGNN